MRFYSNGKLLITGEYLVLDGAKAFALPTKFGQDLVINNGTNKQIVWKSFDADKTIWFEDTILFAEIINKARLEDGLQRKILIEILHQGYLLNPDFITLSEGYIITTHLTFPKFWGLGTSSTLINNIAQWLHIDAFDLLKNSFGGSGYDIACAQQETPILFLLQNGNPTVEIADFNPNFTANLYFVYLNKKQNSKAAIASYYKKEFDLEKIIVQIDAITDLILKTNDLKKFSDLLEAHEKIMSAILETPTIKKSLFNDFDGVVKSLGAWGGDFVLVISEKNPSSYFKEKGYETILGYNEMIL